MILLKPIQIDTIEDLRVAVQKAIMLEHSTIPPYLTANFTLYDTGNDEISNLIGSVVGEEMLHLSIACNLMNAIGGTPVLNQPDFIPAYPGPLPGGVETGLVVPIAKFSMHLLKTVFMEIEEPEDPIHIKLMMVAAKNVPEPQMTIGRFYEKIKEQVQALGESIFTGDPKKQLTFAKFFPEKLLFPITDVASAIRGINIIIDQGEGTSKDPFITPIDEIVTEPAHYYRFEEIYKGKTLVKNPLAENGFSYSGAPIPFNEKLIPNMKENPRMNAYPKDSLAYVNSKLFNYTYTSLLNSLHRTFNGEPQQINAAMGLMFSLRLYALKLLAIPDPNDPQYRAGPSYEFVTDEDLSPTDRDALVNRTIRSQVVKISSGNIPASVQFYTKLLGFATDDRYTINKDDFGTGSYVQLTLPGSSVTIGLYKDIDKPMPTTNNGTVPSFIVADVAGFRDFLLSKGVVVGDILSDTSDQNYTDRFAFFSDPDNNALVIRQDMKR